MLFKVADDWKQHLHPEDELRMNNIIKRVAKHRSAYRTSKDVKVAQLWCALLELDKKQDETSRDMRKLRMIIEGFAEVIKKVDAEDKKLLESLEKF